MPSSYLFALNNEGRVNLLSTNSTAWREMKYVGLDFKRISAVPHFLWGVGGDRQVYVHVYGLDVPIRVKEECYENERWIPIEGFTSRLLPTDRYHFSSADGTVDRSIDRIRVPSMAWQWESEWHLETILNGKPLDHDGWTYAVDFPAQFYDKKDWKSCVRRRKWVRYRRYTAMNSWCAVSPLHKDPTQEPFIDVAVGGTNIPGAEPGTLTVWAVTAHGRVMFRMGVSTVSPEGIRWVHIATPTTYEVTQLTVGATGLVWTTLWNGKIIVRSGITRDNPSGECWLDVRPPGDGLSVHHISVGYNAVWAVTTNHKVWFRKGINGDMAGVSEEAAIGSRWVEQSGDMMMISVAFNDQVFAIGSEDRSLYFRDGVTVSELTGKTWRLIHVPMQLSRASSTASLALCLKFQNDKKQHRSLSYLNKHQSFEPCSLTEVNWDETSHSAPEAVLLSRSTSNQSSYNDNKKDSKSNSYCSRQNSSNASSDQNMNLEKNSAEIVEYSMKQFETPLKSHKVFNAIKSAGSVVATEACPEFDVWRDETHSGGDSAIFGDDESLQLFWTEYDAMWTWITANACLIDSNFLPNWFVDVPNQPDLDLTQPWRMDILNQLRDRLTDQCSKLDLTNYELAIEMSSWIKRCEAKLVDNTPSCPQTMSDYCTLEMEWIHSSNKVVQSATLTVLDLDKVTVLLQINLSDVTCVMCCSEPGNPRLAVFVPNMQQEVIKFQFSNDTDLEDWLANLSVVCCQINKLDGRPSSDCLWITTGLGDIFTYDPQSALKQQRYGQLYSIELKLQTDNDYEQSVILDNGFREGDTLIISGCIDELADRVSFNLDCPKQPNKESCDTALHYNPRFNENIIVKNTYRNGQWDSYEERESISILEPGLEFTLQIICLKEGFRIFCHGKEVSYYKHRLPPDSINVFRTCGKLKIFKTVYRSKMVVVSPKQMFWRQIGGHLKQVESAQNGIVWGISFDNTAWVFTGGWGGAFLQGLETSNFGISTMIDYQNYYVYENQRWNPVSGYTSTGLPTDRYMWSDSTGKHKRTRDHAKPLSKNWQWVSEWQIDFNTPGGVDRDGWQYAVDFPATYHAKKQFTDMVRRRRWYRRCQLTTSGPWQELSNTKIMDLSLYSENPQISSQDNSQDNPQEEENFTSVWAISTCGDALFRTGVSLSNMTGNGWQHISCDQPLSSISCGPLNRVWAVTKNGSVYWRLGSSDDQPQAWNSIEPPSCALLKQISCGFNTVWAVDFKGKLSVRKQVTQHFPEGTGWQTLHSEKDNEDLAAGFRQVTAGTNANEVWAVSQSGLLCRRAGVCPENPSGNGWVTAVKGNWHSISISHWKRLST